MSLRLVEKYFVFFVFISFFWLSSCSKNLVQLTPNSSNASSKPQKEKQVSAGEEVQNAEQKPKEKEEDQVDTVLLNQVTGSVFSTNISQLSFRTSGHLAHIYAQNGQFVKQGQVIAKLDDQILMQQLKLMQYALEQAQTNAHFAKLTLNRIESLNQKQATTQASLEQAQQAFQTADISVKQAEANLHLAEIDFKESTLLAPYDGVVYNMSLGDKTYVTSNSSIASIVSLKDLQIQIPIPQTIENTFKIGQKFRFSAPSKSLQGSLTISGIVPYVDPSSKSYMLFGRIDQSSVHLMPGELILIHLKDK